MNNFFGTEFVWWQGVVEDVLDPLFLGRLKVRIFGYHTQDKTSNGIPTSELPWAYTIQPITSAALSGVGTSPTGIVPGTYVIGFFRDGHSAQQPMVFGTLPGIPSTKANPDLGFNDPSGKYPAEDYIGESDVNRLARNQNIEKTIVKSKDDSISTEIPIALSDFTWNEPKSSYNASYPKNHVYQSESGHIKEYDDTPGSERIHEYHKSGTFEEIHPDGTIVTKVVKDRYTLILRDDRVFIDGSANVTISGNCNIYTKQNSNIQVGGNCNLYTVGDVTEQIDGDYTLYVKGNYVSFVEGKYTSESSGNMRFDAPRIDLNP